MQFEYRPNKPKMICNAFSKSNYFGSRMNWTSVLKLKHQRVRIRNNINNKLMDERATIEISVGKKN